MTPIVSLDGIDGHATRPTPWPIDAKTPSSPASADAHAPTKLSTDFEAAMLAPLMEAMLPDERSAFWGGGGGRAWRGLFAQEIAAEIARAGGIGLAGAVDDVIAESRGTAS